MMKTYYFCFGDYRSGKKEYRIFKVRSVQDAYKVADALGYEIILDNCNKNNLITDPEERIIVSILETIEAELHGIENVVSCYREEHKEALRLRRHFQNSDISRYFPKLLPQSANSGFSARRNYPWIEDYYVEKYKHSPPPPQDLVFRVAYDEFQQAAIHKK